jgi:hypothetical protein
MELDSAGGAAAFSPMQDRDGRRPRGAGRLLLVAAREMLGPGRKQERFGARTQGSRNAQSHGYEQSAPRSCVSTRLSHKSPGAKVRRQLSRSKDFWEGSETNQSPGNGSVWAAADICDSLPRRERSTWPRVEAQKRVRLRTRERQGTRPGWGGASCGETQRQRRAGERHLGLPLSSSGRCGFRLVLEALCLVRERLEPELVGCCERGGQELECLVAVAGVVAS